MLIVVPRCGSSLRAHNLAARVLLLRDIVAIARVRRFAADEVARIRICILHLTRQRIPKRIVSERADAAQRRNAFQQQMLLLLRFRVAVRNVLDTVRPAAVCFVRLSASSNSDFS